VTERAFKLKKKKKLFSQIKKNYFYSSQTNSTAACEALDACSSWPPQALPCSAGHAPL
jgi:hypothetical protein